MSRELKPRETVLDGSQMARVIRRMADQIAEIHRGVERVLLIGIRTRGLPLAERLKREIVASEGVEVPVGALDITLYRDDLSTVASQPVVKSTELPGNLDGVAVVLTDDVLYTGRTIRAALDALMDFGRPRSIRLAVLVDRGHRELPIQADVVGKRVETAADELVEVRFTEVDGVDRVEILAPEGG
ncbi:MAG: bifunctional pyr operon transcriptional regulator/uracil phosphoribosyltransferase PyrR [Thermoanaerobaculia bacterium]|nr:bifunctional pyr operon transcriptional regulator/uracil phosphoribosyltransferase PyrR [Thermoanaerobaculia bacterium]